jgi:hypothetical protein
MGNSKRHQQALYLDHDKANLLDEPAKATKILRAVPARDAIDDLLMKFKRLKVAAA